MMQRAAWTVFSGLALGAFAGLVGANFGRDTTEFHILGAVYLVGAILAVGLFLLIMAVRENKNPRQ
jgi:hypothetical protein